MVEKENAGWESAETARNYREVADLVAPGRREILGIIARAAREFGPERPRVLDLGGGYGEVTASITDLTPAAEICLLDLSDEMLAMAGERFAGAETVTVRKHDLNKGLPKDLKTGDYDAVVSCFALHHVALKRRVPLYRDILTALKPEGVFINGDRFKGESPAGEWELDNWVAWMVEARRRRTGVAGTFEEVKANLIESDRQMGDRPETIWSTRDALKKAGFRSVDCVWMYLNLGVLVAFKAAADA